MRVTMPYIGGVLSENSYKIRGRGGVKTNKTKPEVEQWMEELKKRIWAMPEHMELLGNQFLDVSIQGTFIDRRNAVDLHNLHKVLGDALEPAFTLNDKYIRFSDLPNKYDSECNPTIELEIK